MTELQTDLNPTEEMVCVHPIWARLSVRGCSNFRTITPALGIARLLCVYEGDPMATIAPPGLETPGSCDNEQLHSPGAEEQI